ncbi:MAG: hypothetical protein JW963_11395 [Anaerolineales bacterium]|nr:hypothetical protein [Anaerolineales bacterium]
MSVGTYVLPNTPAQNINLWGRVPISALQMLYIVLPWGTIARTTLEKDRAGWGAGGGWLPAFPCCVVGRGG